MTSNVVPPWRCVDDFVYLDYSEDVYNNVTFLSYVGKYYRNSILLFTDGFKVSDGEECSVAAALFVPSQSTSKCWKLRSDHSVISSELYAILGALQYCVDNEIVNAVIFSDSKSGLQLILLQETEYYNIIFEIKILLLNLNMSGRVHLHWVRAHCGIVGNEIADQSAKNGHKNIQSELFDLSSLEWNSILKRQILKYWNSCWVFNSDASG